jgi:hypothetical protein
LGLGKRRGKREPSTNPKPTQKAKSTPMGNLRDSQVKNLKTTGLIFWIEKTAMVIIQPARKKEEIRLIIIFINSARLREEILDESNQF